MENIINKKYPVFEANQVLSNKHLNGLVSYLEEQDRLSRTCLLGMGIVCGLDIELSPAGDTLTISSGTALTSLGFLIKFETSTFSHFKDADISENFISPILEEDPQFKKIYEHRSNYNFLTSSHQLLPNATDSLGELDEARLHNKVVILLLETKLIDIKNCIGTDCDDKGKRLEFNLKPIVVDQSWVSLFEQEKLEFMHFRKLHLPKFDTPKTNLVTGNDIFDTYKDILNGNVNEISEQVKSVYDHYQPILMEEEALSNLTNLFPTLSEAIDQNQGYMIQYVYDWVGDIIATYNQIIEQIRTSSLRCCPHEGAFPFHVSLGVAYHNTFDIDSDRDLRNLSIYRDQFIKTGILSDLEEDVFNNFISLFKRLSNVVTSFEVDEKLQIKITPSQYGKCPLSDKAIPFYYKKEEVETLNRNWSYLKTKQLRNDEILAYHSSSYSGYSEVNNPLNFDQEEFNFYRIEGHIGKEYDKSLANIEAQRAKYRLPFKVIGINAVNPNNRKIDVSNAAGTWDDLEFDYDLAKEKVYNITEYVIGWIERNRVDIQKDYALFTDQIIDGLKSILTESRTLLANDLNDFLPNYEKFYEVFEGLNDLFLSHRACITGFAQPSTLLEDFVDHLDQINTLFLEDAFTVIHTEANRRVEKSISKTFLRNYLDKHPEITHSAGVPKGGTFILVYADYSIFQTRQSTINTEFLLGRIQDYMKVFNFSNQKKEAIKKRNVVRKRRQEKKLASNPKELSDDCKETAKKVENNILANLEHGLKANLSKEVYRYIDFKKYLGTTLIQNPTTDTTPQKIVLADFFLPYICCGDGDNINIIIKNVDVEPNVADFDHNHFNSDDFNTNNPNS